MVLIQKHYLGEAASLCQTQKDEKTTLAVMEKRHVSGEPVQTFQVVECKPCAQARYRGVFTVVQRLHLCLSGSLLVKALQASVLAETLQPASDMVGGVMSRLTWTLQLLFLCICSSFCI